MFVGDIDVSIAIHHHRRPKKNSKIDWIVYLRSREMVQGMMEFKRLRATPAIPEPNGWRNLFGLLARQTREPTNA